MKPLDVLRVFQATTALCFVILTGAVARGEAMDGMITPYTDSGPTYIAVPLELSPGEAISAVRWYNNDGTTALPEVLLVGNQDGLPDFEATLYSKDDVFGSSDTWTELSLVEPIAAPGGAVFAVFKVPAITRTATGVGGGPGIGYRETDEDAVAALLSADGLEWVSLPATIELAVEFATTGGELAKKATEEQAADGEPTSFSRPRETGLNSAYPNPANPSLRVKFTMADPGKARLLVYNVRGQLVRRLVDRWVPAGEHQVQWLGTDRNGQNVSSGVYYVQFQAHGVQERTRVTVVQ